MTTTILEKMLAYCLNGKTACPQLLLLHVPLRPVPKLMNQAVPGVAEPLVDVQVFPGKGLENACPEGNAGLLCW